MTSTGLQLIQKALTHQQPERTPVLPLVGLFASKLADVSTSDMLHDATKQSQALLKARQKFGYDGVFNVMDLTVEAEALGAEIVFETGTFPYVKKHPLDSFDDLDGMELPSVHDTRLKVFVESSEKLFTEIGNTHLVSSYIIGPFTLAGHLFGVEKLLTGTFESPDEVDVAIENCVRILTPYLRELLTTGSHNIVILEPSASNSIISPSYFERFSAPHIKRMNDIIHSEDAYATLHICGDTNRIIRAMVETNADALSIDSAVDLEAAKKNTEKKSTLIGSVDTTLLLKGSIKQVREAAQDCIAKAANGGGYILSSGCDFAIETPTENLASLVGTVFI
jgi:uroporphyrinogen decarboxylase